MNTKIDFDAQTTAIAANLELLHALLTDAANRSVEAHDLIKHGERNGAIGVVASLDVVLNDAKALCSAALALHRTTPVALSLDGV